jgi:hypothetical protein|tara:strand:- start:728 stop:1078 length:351 start_codon:yes stop_codon:yes gene_type:complete
MLIQKSKIKQLINSKGLSVSAISYDSIDRLVSEVIDKVCLNTTNDGMKTVMPQHCHLNQAVAKASESVKLENVEPEIKKMSQYLQKWIDHRFDGHVTLHISLTRFAKGDVRRSDIG